MDLTLYQRYLPHQLPPGHPFFVTFRLAGSLPAKVVARLQEEQALLEQEAANQRAAGHSDKAYDRQKRWFARFDSCLDNYTTGPAFLAQAAIGPMLAQAVQFYHGRGDYVLLGASCPITYTWCCCCRKALRCSLARYKG